MYIVTLFLIVALVFSTINVKIDSRLCWMRRVKEVFSTQLSVGQELYNATLAGRHLDYENHYKFFNELLFEVENMAKRFGAPRKWALFSLKQGMKRDLDQERKIKSSFASALLTFSASAFVTWSFTFFTLSAMKIGLSYSFITLSITWQLIGVMVFILLFNKMKQRLLEKFYQLFRSSYKLAILSQVSISTDELISMSDVNKALGNQQTDISHLQDRILILIEQRRLQGQSIKDDLMQTIDEIWMFYAQRCEVLHKHVTILKFIVLCVFFFSTYLISIFNVLARFNI